MPAKKQKLTFTQHTELAAKLAQMRTDAWALIQMIQSHGPINGKPVKQAASLADQINKLRGTLQDLAFKELPEPKDQIEKLYIGGATHPNTKEN